MNRVFKVVFNKTTGAYHAVSENVKAQKKGQSVLSSAALCVLTMTCMQPALADGLLFQDGISHEINQSVIDNPKGIAIDLSNGSSVVFSEKLADSDVTVSGINMGMMVGEGGSEMTKPASVTVNAKNITVTATGNENSAFSSAYAIQTSGTDKEASTVTLKASENIVLKSTVSDGSQNIVLNNSDGLGAITVEAGEKISIEATAPTDNTLSHAIYASSSKDDIADSIVSLKAKDIEALSNEGIVAFNEHSKVTLEAENTNIVHSVGAQSANALSSWAWKGYTVEQKGAITLTGASNQVTADHGTTLYARAGDITLTANKDSNIVKSSDGIGVLAFDKADVVLNAEKDNVIDASRYALYSGLSYQDPITQEKKDTSGSITLTAENNTITSSTTYAISAINESSVDITSREKLTVSSPQHAVSADTASTVTMQAKEIDISDGTSAVLAANRAQVDTQSDKMTLNGQNFAVSANTEATVSMQTKEAEINGKDALLAFSGGKVELNVSDNINLNADDYAAYASGDAASVTINASEASGGTVVGDIVAGHGGQSALIGNALTANSNIYIMSAVVNAVRANIPAETTETIASADLKNGSILTGYIDDGTEAQGINGKTKLTLAENSTWQVTEDSAVTELKSNNSTIDLSAGKNAPYKRVTAGTFSGTNNTINLRIDLADETVSDNPEERKTDQLHILQSNGDSDNKVNVIIEKDTTDESKVHSNNWLVKADNVAGTLKMQDASQMRLAADGSEKTWQLKFVQDGQTLDAMSNKQLNALSDSTTDEGGEWYLVRSSDDNDETTTVKDFASAYGEYYAWFSDLSDLRQRLGEVRSGAREGAWAKASYSKYSADGIGNGRFDADDYSVHLGYDHIVSENDEGAWLVGGSFKGGHTDMNGSRGSSADVNHYSAKVYGTYIANNGNYADFVGSVGYFDKKFEGSSNTGLKKATGDYNTWGAGLSAEVGKKIPFAERLREDGSMSSWFVEPQAQLSYYWVKGKDFTTSTGMKVEQEDTDFLTGRLGFLLGHKISESAKDPNKRYVQVAVRGGLMHEFLGDDVIHVNGQRREGSIDGTAVYYGVDFDWNFADNQRLYIQLDRAHSSDYTKEIEARIGYRYQF